MALPLYVQSGTATSGWTANGTLDVPYPAGPTNGNKLLLRVFVWSDTNGPLTINTPAGWTLEHADHITVLATDSHALSLFSKVSDGTETGNVTVTFTELDGSGGLQGQMDEYSGADTLENTNGTPFTSGNGASISMPGVTTTGTDRLAVAYGAVADDATVDNATGETGGDWANVVSASDTFGSDAGIWFQRAALASAGTISGGTAAHNRSTDWMARAIALVPPSAEAPSHERIFDVTVTGRGE